MCLCSPGEAPLQPRHLACHALQGDTRAFPISISRDVHLSRLATVFLPLLRGSSWQLGAPCCWKQGAAVRQRDVASRAGTGRRVRHGQGGRCVASILALEHCCKLPACSHNHLRLVIDTRGTSWHCYMGTTHDWPGSCRFHLGIHGNAAEKVQLLKATLRLVAARLSSPEGHVRTRKFTAACCPSS